MLRLSLIFAAGFAFAVSARAESFKLSSADITPNARIAEEQMFEGFGCAGKICRLSSNGQVYQGGEEFRIAGA